MSQANEPYERGREIVPGYRLVKLLGRGGFGEVWKATAPGGTEVAVKVIRLGGHEGRKELKALQLVKQVRHPHLVPITAFWIKREDGTVVDDEEIASSNLLTDTRKLPKPPTQTMLLPVEHEELEAAELIIAMGLGRETLYDRLKGHQKQGRPGIPQDELIEYVKDAAQAIDYLNNPIEDLRSTGIQHCDVKPHNIMLVGGATQVCDFGLAQMLGAKRTTTPMATLAYAAPECLQQGEPSSTTDQYSLAVTYYELRTGTLPYREGTYGEVFNRKLRGDLDFSGVSQPERAVLRRAAAIDPGKRYASCTEMIKALELAVAPKEEAERKRPGLLRRLLALAAVCAAAVVAAWALWPAGPNGPPSDLTLEEFVRQFRDLLHEGEFPKALKRLETPPPRLTEPRKESLREEARTAWSAAILRARPEKPPQTVGDECGGFLEHFPKDHPIRLVRADAYATLREWPDALRDLNALETDGSLPPPLAGQTGKLREKVQAGWLAQMAGNRGEESPQATCRDCNAFLKHFPESPDARLIRARALVRLDSYGEALKDLETLQAAEDLPKQLRPLQLALVLITADSRPQRDPVALLSHLEGLENLKDSTPPKQWSLDPWERNQITDAADRLFSDLLGKAGDHVGQEQLDEARKILRLADKPFAPEDKRAQIRLWQAVLDPQTEVGQPAWATATELMRDGTLPEQRALAKALGQICHKQLDPQALERQLHEAVQVVRIGCDNPREKQIRRQLGELWKQRIAVLLTADVAPTVEEHRESEKDWELAQEAGFSSSLVDAWRAECLLVLGLDASLAYELVNRAVLEADDLPADQKVYLHYVRALGLRLSEILDDLDQVFPDSGPPPPFLSVRNRLARAVELAANTAEHRRQQAAKQAPSQLDRVLGVLPADQQAEPYCRVLQNAYRAGKPGLDPGQIHKIEVNLVLAAWHQPEPDRELARSLTIAWPELAEDTLPEDAIPVLYVCVKSRLGEPDPARLGPEDRPRAIRACTRLLGLLGGSGEPAVTLTGEDAVSFYSTTVQEAVTTADLAADALKQSGGAGADSLDLEHFYAAAGDFILAYKYANWPLDEHGDLEKLFDRAITLHQARTGANPDPQRLSHYYLKRGQARVGRRQPDFDQALDDANTALRLNPALHGGYGLQSNVYVVRSRQQETHEDRVADLTQSIHAGKEAVAACPPADSALADYLLTLSAACIEAANFHRDPDDRQQKELLENAVEYANRAASLKQGSTDYPYLALGNAYEDLAWLVEHDPVENYKKAIDVFTDASRKNPWNAQFLTNRGRCFYKCVADTRLDPAALEMGFQTRNDVVERAKRDLQDALNQDGLLIEASLWLGLANQYQGRYEEADKGFERAKSLADRQQLAERVVYVATWAKAPLGRGDLGDNRFDLVLARALELVTDPPMPLTPSTDPEKEVAWIRGQVNVGKGESAQALALYDDALPPDASQAVWSDLTLLLARAQYRLSLPDDEWDRSAAEAAIHDAEQAAHLAIYRQNRREAHYYAALANARAYHYLTFTDDAEMTKEQRKALHLDAAISQILQAVRIAPRDPRAPQWCEDAAVLLMHRRRQADDYGPRARDTKEALACLDHAIRRIEEEKRLADTHQQREKLDEQGSALTSNRGKTAGWLQADLNEIHEQIKAAADPQRQAELKTILSEIEDYQPSLLRP